MHATVALLALPGNSVLTPLRDAVAPRDQKVPLVYERVPSLCMLTFTFNGDDVMHSKARTTWLCAGLPQLLLEPRKGAVCCRCAGFCRDAWVEAVARVRRPARQPTFRANAIVLLQRYFLEAVWRSCR